MKKWIFICLSLIISSIAFAQISSPGKTAYVMTVNGAMGPATQAYIKKGLDLAKDNQAAVAIIKLNTPGGLVKSTRAIIQDVLSSPVPVATYVSPSGAHAASAGTFLLYASQIAAMSPGTNLGAATPVSMGSPSTPAQPGQKDNKKPNDAVMKKVTNDTAAYIRSLAELHGRNVKWAELAVTKAESLTAKSALKKNVIDMIATDLPDLLKQMNGRKVKVLGRMQTLHTDNLVIKQVGMNFRERLLAVIGSPDIAYILLIVGIYGIIFEFMNPGMIVPAVLGVICLLLGVYGLHVLPVNFVGVLLILGGILLMVLEAFISTFGILAIGGIVAFFIGSLMLFDRSLPGYEVGMSVAIGITIVTAIFFLFVVRIAAKSFKKPIVSGAEELIGMEGEIFLIKKDSAMAHIHGERWEVVSDDELKRGQKVRVIGRDGLVLKVSVCHPPA